MAFRGFQSVEYDILEHHEARATTGSQNTFLHRIPHFYFA
jgi:hypothetical protein